MIKDFIENKVSELSDGHSDRDEYEVLKEIRNKTVRRIKDLSSTPDGVLYNNLFRECLENIILGYMPTEHPCIRYREYEKVRNSLIKDLPYDTHVLMRDEYFTLLTKIEENGMLVLSKYKEV